jgi:fatty acid desaturase
LQFFRYSADRLPVTCIVSLFLMDLAVYFYVESVWLLLEWIILTATPKIGICAWNHHHQHVLTFRQPVLNRLLELVYAFHTGITTNAWVLHHVLGHHVNYLDQTKDESAWKRSTGEKMGEWEYTLTIAATGYLRAFNVSKRFPKYHSAFFGMGTAVIALLSVLLYYNWFNALFVFVIPMVFGYLVTCWHTYCHHAGLDTENHFEASHNIMHRWYNILAGNLGYHTAHHVKPGLHWSKLPEYHATIADKIPAHLYIEPCVPFKWLPG